MYDMRHVTHLGKEATTLRFSQRRRSRTPVGQLGGTSAFCATSTARVLPCTQQKRITSMQHACNGMQHTCAQGKWTSGVRAFAWAPVLVRVFACSMMRGMRHTRTYGGWLTHKNTPVCVRSAQNYTCVQAVLIHMRESGRVNLGCLLLCSDVAWRGQRSQSLLVATRDTSQNLEHFWEK